MRTIDSMVFTQSWPLRTKPEQKVHGSGLSTSRGTQNSSSDPLSVLMDMPSGRILLFQVAVPMPSKLDLVGGFSGTFIF